MNSKINQDLLELLWFALEEYTTNKLHKNDFSINDHTQCTFGQLVADISMIAVEKNRLYLRRYDVRSADEGFKTSFILGHAAMLFGIGSRNFRENLISAERIKGVITLKQSVFKQIAIPAAVIILNNKSHNTWFTSTESIETFAALLQDDVKNVQPLYYSSEIYPENLLPEFYNGDDKVIEKSFEGSQTKTLDTISEIINGKGAKREDFSKEGIPYLRARDIQNRSIVKPELFIDKEKIKNFSKQLIQEGDILLTKYFGQNKLAIVTEADVPAIASNGLFIIRPFDVSEGYLYDYLTSKTGNDIFNKQLSRVQKGVTVPSVTLADLKKIVVPVFDQDIMENLENIEFISREEAIATAKKLMKSSKFGSELEMIVRKDLINSGWNESCFVTDKKATIVLDDRRWIPDFTYIMPDGRKTIVEVKSDISLIRPDWLQAVSQILSKENNYIFVLTTGVYYEIHFSGVSQSFKTTEAPTIAQILEWDKEVH